MVLLQQSASALRPGRDYPRTYGELRSWFPDDDACLNYLEWLRWPGGFMCPRCGQGGSRLGDGRFWCEPCHHRASVTAGTIFHRTRTPLTVWFAAAWFMTSSKNGVSAKTLHRLLGFGAYQTAWAMLHRFRTAMVRVGRDRLHGEVEVDETYIGGVKPQKFGRAAGGKVLVAVAVERRQPRGFGRCRLRVIAAADRSSLRSFIRDNIEPGSTILTDGHASYPAATRHEYVHAPANLTRWGEPAHVALPAVHRVASLVKRWLLGTHQGAVEVDHLQAYLDEYAFRFNRRHAEFRGLLFRRLLEQSVAALPVTYRSMVVNPAAKKRKPKRPPRRRRVGPETLAASVPSYPWRNHNP